MCKQNQKIKLCTCSKDQLDFRNESYWELVRKRKCRNNLDGLHIVGSFISPYDNDYFGECYKSNTEISSYICEQLNNEDLFDIKINFKQDDILTLSLLHLIRTEYHFIYDDNQWVITEHPYLSPLVDINDEGEMINYEFWKFKSGKINIQ